MPRPLELLESDLDDSSDITASELGLDIDLARDDLDEAGDDLGFRSLYEHPEAALGHRRRPRAA